MLPSVAPHTVLFAHTYERATAVALATRTARKAWQQPFSRHAFTLDNAYLPTTGVIVSMTDRTVMGRFAPTCGAKLAVVR